MLRVTFNVKAFLSHDAYNIQRQESSSLSPRHNTQHHVTATLNLKIRN
jgi:hypothetical protein